MKTPVHTSPQAVLGGQGQGFPQNSLGARKEGSRKSPHLGKGMFSDTVSLCTSQGTSCIWHNQCVMTEVFSFFSHVQLKAALQELHIPGMSVPCPASHNFSGSEESGSCSSARLAALTRTGKALWAPKKMGI